MQEALPLGVFGVQGGFHGGRGPSSPSRVAAGRSQRTPKSFLGKKRKDAMQRGQ